VACFTPAPLLFSFAVHTTIKRYKQRREPRREAGVEKSKDGALPDDITRIPVEAEALAEESN